MTETLPLRVLRRVKAQCRRGCDEPLADGSDYCRRHHEEQKAHQRASASRRRDVLRKNKKCIDCESSSKKLRCSPCHKRHVAAERSRRGVESERRGVESPAQIPDPTWRPDRDGHARYRGSAVRGRPSMATLDEQDFDCAFDAMTKARRGFELTQTAEVGALPRIQREAADRAWLAFLDLAERFFDELRERHKYGQET